MIVHWDLKSSNIFISENMQLKIGDFGLSTRLQDVWERKYSLCGTPAYISPEMLFKKGQNLSSDIWSFGVVVYEMLYGKTPFERQSLEETYQAIEDDEIMLDNKLVSFWANNFLEFLLQKDHKKRPKIIEII